MPQHFRVPRTLVRSLGPAFLLTIAFLLSPDSLFGQHVTGLNITKSCPITAAPGSTVTCTFSIQNQDTQHGVVSLSVTNTVPFPGGPTTPVSCNQGGNPVTSLGVNGTPTDTCTGSINETAPPCGSTDTSHIDQVSAVGMDAGVAGLQVSGATSNSFIVLACTPTPTPTPTNTPTNTPINTPTLTPTLPAPPPTEVPTLSFPMMALLGLALAGAGLFLARR